MCPFFGKSLKFNVDFKNANIKIEKRFLVSEITESELASLNSFYYEGKTCHGQSMR